MIAGTANVSDPAPRDPKRAVEIARKAVSSVPRGSNYRNTVGIACCRAGALDEARAALERSMELGKRGNAIAPLFMAMVCRASDQVELAGDWYDPVRAQWRRSSLPTRSSSSSRARPGVCLPGAR